MTTVAVFVALGLAYVGLRLVLRRGRGRRRASVLPAVLPTLRVQSTDSGATYPRRGNRRDLGSNP